MIVVHHLITSRSIRILWLLEELGLDYEVVFYQRDPVTMEAPTALRQVHPLGKAPVLCDGERVIAESGAIIEYLLDVYDDTQRLRPKETADLLDFRYWLHFAEGSMMPLLVMRLVLGKACQAPMLFFAKPIVRRFVSAIDKKFIQPRLACQLGQIDQRLQLHTWFAGDRLSGADIQMIVPLQMLKRAQRLQDYPHIRDFLTRIEQLPSFQRAMHKAESKRLC